MSGKPSETGVVTVRRLLQPLSKPLIALWLLSALLPFFWLVPPLYMQQIMSRVALSRSLGSFWSITALSIFLLVMQTVVEHLRSTALRRMGVDAGRRLQDAAFSRLEKTQAPPTVFTTILGEIAYLREFLSGPQLTYLYDAFWSPAILIVLYLLHPMLAVTGLVLVGLSGLLAYAGLKVSDGPSRAAQTYATQANDLGTTLSQREGLVRLLGMVKPLRQRWADLNEASLGWQHDATSRMQLISSISRFMQNFQMVAFYGVGCLLYLNNQISLTTMFVASIVALRGIGALGGVVANWRGLTRARQATQRIDEFLRVSETIQAKVKLPPPSGPLQAERVSVISPGGKIILSDISFSAEPGTVVGIVGASGSGKSALASVLMRALKPSRGTVSLGGHDIQHFPDGDYERVGGFLPQFTEFVKGTVADNITRFGPDTSTDALIKAAQFSQLSDVIGTLPAGYATMIGPGGHPLSGGVAQRIALARAVYGHPHLLVFDEPTSHLDASGEQALLQGLSVLREQGSIAIVVSHKMNVLQHCDEILVLSQGTLQAFGTRSEILERASKMQARALPSTQVKQLI